MIASIQGSRMDDQRADAAALFPGLHSSPALMRQMQASMHPLNTQTTILDDDQFFETLMRCQVCGPGMHRVSCGEELSKEVLYCTMALYRPTTSKCAERFGNISRWLREEFLWLNYVSHWDAKI